MAVSGGCATLPVANFDRSIRLYTEALGLTLVIRFGDEWACLDAGNGTLVGRIPRSEGDSQMSLGLCAPDDFEGAVNALDQRDVAVELPD